MTKTQRSQIVSTVLLGAVKKAADMRIISREKQAGDDDDDSDSESEAEIMQMPVTPVNNAGMTRRHQRTAAIAAESKLRQVTPNPEVFGERAASVRKERDRMWETRPGAAGVGMNSMVVRLRVGRENLARLARQTMVAV